MEHDLNKKLTEIHTALVGYNGKRGLIDDVQDHEKRIRYLEKWRWYIAGAVAIIGFAVLVFVRAH